MEIDQDSYGYCNVDYISSGGLGPCIGIGILNKRKRTGYMLHYTDFKNEDKLETVLYKIIQHLEDKNSLKIYVTGSSFSESDDDAERCEENRNYVKSALLSTFKRRQIIFDWLKPNQVTELIMDVDNGIFENTPLYVDEITM
jgi:hypothetical protein